MKILSANHIAFAVSLVLICVITVVFSQGLSTGKNLHYDEFYSLERSNGFEKFNDWFSVYSQNEPTAKKPPLQYWTNAVLSKLPIPEILAFRLASFLFLIGSIICTALLCYTLSSNNPWTLVAGILLAASSAELLQAGRSAMLDAGLCFFMLGALLAFFYARQNPKWWLICGLLIGLGAMQKAPMGLVYVAVLLFILNKKSDDYYNWKHLRTLKPFNRSLWLTLFLLLAWPVLQTIRLGGDYFDIAIRHQMIKRMSPLGDDRIKSIDFFKWFDWVWDDIHLIAIVAMICTILAFSLKKLRKDNALFAICLLVGIISLGLSLATGKIYARYMVALSPLLIVVSVKVISDCLPWKPAVLILGLLAAFTGTNRIRENIDYIYARDSFSRSKELVARLDSYTGEEDYIFIEKAFLPPGAYGYFSPTTRPFFARKLIKKSDLRRAVRTINNRDFPIVGICSRENEALVQSLATEYTQLYADEEMLIWRYEKPTLNKKDS